MHNHHHDHHDHHEGHNRPLSFEEKLLKLMEHWMKHNAEHAATYREWAEKAGENNLDRTVLMILEAADLTLQINGKLQQAVAALRDEKGF